MELGAYACRPFSGRMTLDNCYDNPGRLGAER